MLTRVISVGIYKFDLMFSEEAVCEGKYIRCVRTV